MIFIRRTQTDPYFNLAAEEYILKNFRDDVVMLWQSEPCVVVGKHQNTLNEVNVQFVQKENIPVIRRISGGGTVYHDPGNLNFTVITTETNREKLIDFRKFTQPVITFLQTLGIRAEFEGKNNLVIKGKKFSGNSAHVYKNRVLHHGTLLFHSDLEKLGEAIRPELKEKINDKAVRSIRATVTNISEHLRKEMDIEEFKVKFKMFLLNYFSVNEICELNKTDIQHINKLVSEKYSTWKWNFGYSPAYIFRNDIEGLKVEMKVKNGKITDIIFMGDVKQKEKLTELLTDLPHRKKEITGVLNSLYNDKKIIEVLKALLAAN
ncbi:MAG: lipoate--protein ligase [Chlorobi bacterium]|nr:lipoate--protein ligase [Chlorobiota bacterium]